MNTRKSLLLLSSLFIVCQAFGQAFILQECNIKKNTTQCINAAKKAHMVLLKKQTLYTLAISPKSTLTMNSVNLLSEKFSTFFPKESEKSDGPTIERGFENPRDQVVKLTYTYLPPDKYETTDYAQIIVVFDNSGDSPKILDIQVKNKVDLGIQRITEREKMKFKPAPVAQKPAAEPTAKPATTTAKPSTKPATTTTAKPKTTKPATSSSTKSTTKPAPKTTTQSTAKPAAKQTSKPATKTTAKPATDPKKKN